MIAQGLAWAERGLKKLLYSLPETVSITILRTYWTIRRLMFQGLVWYRYNRQYDAPIRPFDLYWIDPDKIEYVSKNSPGSRKWPLVAGGDWDQTLYPFEEKSVYSSFQAAIQNDIPWRETAEFDYYQSKYDDPGEAERRIGIVENDNSSVESLEDVLLKYELIYQNIAENGYRTQRELRADDSLPPIPTHFANVFPEYDEITVDIGRDGTLIWRNGQHRLTIAKLLEVDAVPVRVLLRHEQWQRTRDKIWNDPTTVSDDLRGHPDIERVLEYRARR